MTKNQKYYCAYWKGVLQNNLIAKTQEEIVDHILEEHMEHSNIIHELVFKEVVIVDADFLTELKNYMINNGMELPNILQEATDDKE